MSMHICMHGMADHQHSIYSASDMTSAFKDRPYLEWWRDRVSLNNLDAVHQFYCREPNLTSLTLDKSQQKYFVNNGIENIRLYFQKLMSYCADDVQATFEVFRQLLPRFKESCPHPVTWFGMMEICTAYLPISDKWNKFIAKSEEKCKTEEDRVARKILTLAVDVLKQKSDQNYLKDPWMWSENWSSLKRDPNKTPNWTKKLCKDLAKSLELRSDDGAAIEQEVSEMRAAQVCLKSNTVSRVLGLCWHDYPLHFMRDRGWGFLVPDQWLLMSPIANPSQQNDIIVRLRSGTSVSFPAEEIVALVKSNKDMGERKKGGEKFLDVNTRLDFVSGFGFYKLPHPSGEGNVGNPTSMAFLKFIEEGTLWSFRDNQLLVQLAKAGSESSYWLSNRDRVRQQLTVWLDGDRHEGAIAAAIVPAGTITRRAVERLWMTASNPKENRIGSELKSMIEAPDKYVLVGADVDSQEQWIAGILGDKYMARGRAGSTPFSEMLLIGNKDDKTDLHSVVAREVGISRDHAKVLNYGRLYGAGVKFAEQFLTENSTLSKSEIAATVRRLYVTTKGTSKQYAILNRDLHQVFHTYLEKECANSEEKSILLNGVKNGNVYLLSPNGDNLKRVEKAATENFEKWMLNVLINEAGISDALLRADDLYVLDTETDRRLLRQMWDGGFESDVFNSLEEISDLAEPRTPVLRCRLSQALIAPISRRNPKALSTFMQHYKRTRINWVVQSSAVDFLHLLLSCMDWLCKEYHIDARFVISIHDEIRYLVAENDKFRCALALQLSNLYVRAAFSQALGINELPQGVAFFSKVDIDKVMRKEVYMECKTPSNVEGLEKGYGIPLGQAYGLSQICAETGGTLEKRIK